MKLRVYSTALFLTLYVSAQAQYRLSGAVASGSDSIAIRDCVVYLNEGKFTAITDGKGRFLFNDVPNGNHVLHFTSVDFQYRKVDVNVFNDDTYIDVMLPPRTQILDEVTITDTQSDFGFTRMRAVENVGNL
jgi:Fe(3+) dicitrate transport protein